MMKSKLKIIVAGMTGMYPVGGVAWDYLQYVIGFSRLGHEVYYYEDTWSWPYHPVEKRNTAKAEYSVQFIKNYFDRYAPELNDHWHYRHLHEHTYGIEKIKFDDALQSADLFLNVSGASIIPENLSRACIKVFLDTDPGYNQIMLSERLSWSENIERWCKSVEDHDQHFTYAENILNDECLVPRLKFKWKTTRMPVVMDLWNDNESTNRKDSGDWTTVMTWNAFKGKLVHQGKEYKSKGSEFKKFMGLPKVCPVSLKIAVGGKNVPLSTLKENGWLVVDGPGTTVTPEEYREFVFSSRGEFSIAKNVYVAMRTGWFSCRSVCYMAAGRPVVVQDTGFSSVIPCGEGIIAFNTLEEAKEGIEKIEQDYELHQKAARELAHTYFGYEVVLKDLLKKAGW
jgi:hypothetical protein